MVPGYAYENIILVACSFPAQLYITVLFSTFHLVRLTIICCNNTNLSSRDNLTRFSIPGFFISLSPDSFFKIFSNFVSKNN
jgi:hypothetical protein